MPLSSESSKANIKSAIKCEIGDVINVFEYGGYEKSAIPFSEIKGSQLVLFCTSTDKLANSFSINC